MAYSDGNSYEEILERCLNNDRLIDIDKRVGSVIYDTLAPLCLELAEAYAKMDIMSEQTYLMTAMGEYLDKRVYDYGLTRRQASQAQVIGSFKKYEVDENGNYVIDEETGERILVDMDIPEGSKFILASNEYLMYTFIGKTDGNNILICETAGSAGSSSLGIILPLSPIQNLVEAKIIGFQVYGEDVETDEELRERAKEFIKYSAFGGNIADYKNKVEAIEGVGQVMVFPAWQHNGSVLLSVVAPSTYPDTSEPTYIPISNDFINRLKEQIDPDEYTGTGVGIAPIGHYVTITTPIEVEFNVELYVEKNSVASEGAVRDEIITSLKEYTGNIRKQFSQERNFISVTRAGIITKLMLIDDVENVTYVILNGMNDDLTYYQNATINGQILPKLGEVTINWT